MDQRLFAKMRPRRTPSLHTTTFVLALDFVLRHLHPRFCLRIQFGAEARRSCVRGFALIGVRPQESTPIDAHWPLGIPMMPHSHKIQWQSPNHSHSTSTSGPYIPDDLGILIHVMAVRVQGCVLKFKASVGIISYDDFGTSHRPIGAVVYPW